MLDLLRQPHPAIRAALLNMSVGLTNLVRTLRVNSRHSVFPFFCYTQWA